MANPSDQTARYCYDAGGERLPIAEPAGATVTFAYGSADPIDWPNGPGSKVVSITCDAASLQPPAGCKTTMPAYDASGRRVSRDFS